MEQPQAMDIRDLWRIIRKRKWYILLPAVILFLVITAIAFLLPAIYKSETLILIENQKIPLEFVQSTVTSAVEERLNIINQRIMSRTRLEQMIDKFDLYPEYREKWTQEEIIEKMREDIHLDIVSADGVDKKSGRPVTFTVAFNLSYEGKDPSKVQKVTSELASLYIEENLRVRVDASAVTTQFMSDELRKMEEAIQKLGKKISDFKQEHLDELPERLQVNVANLDRYERYLETTHRDLASAKSSLLFLRGQLAAVDPDATMVSSYGQRILSPKEQLEIDRTNLISLQARLSDNHPDVVAIKERIERLETEVGGAASSPLREELAQKQNALTELLSTYTDKHPDVIRTRAEIADLREKLAQARAGASKGYAANPTNPAYINLQTQIESKKLEIRALEGQRQEYMKLIEYYQQRIGNTPAVEKVLAAMQSDYDVARANYQELVNKETQAKISESLENRQQGERFAIIDPAQLPEEPYKPNRLAIMFIGLILGIGAGAGAGFLSEYMDQSFSSADELRSFAKLPVLAVIPKVVTQSETLRRRRRTRMALVSSVLALVGILAVVQVFFFKFDILLIKLIREAQKLPIQ